MKIHIKSNDGYGIKLWFPTSLLKSKFILRILKKHGGIDIEPLLNLLPKINKTFPEEGTIILGFNYFKNCSTTMTINKCK